MWGPPRKGGQKEKKGKGTVSLIGYLPWQGQSRYENGRPKQNSSRRSRVPGKKHRKKGLEKLKPENQKNVSPKEEPRRQSSADDGNKGRTN